MTKGRDHGSGPGDGGDRPASPEDRLRERTAELQASEARYRAVIEQSMDCIFIADIETKRILDANRAFREKLGYLPERIHDLNLYDFVAHEREDVDAKADAVLVSGSLSLGERSYRRSDGTTIPMDVSVSVIETGDSRVFCVVSRDITDRMDSERERERFQEQLLQAQKMEAVGIFAGGLAHDFNNIMTAILGRTQLARLFMDDPARVERELAEIERAAESATDLTRQVLLFSRQQPTQKKALNVLRVVERMEGMLSRLLGEDIRVVVEGARDVWTVEADRSNVEQLLMNLAANARDAMPDGGTLRIHVWNITLRQDGDVARRTGHSGRFVRISIADDGTGMDDGTLARIFDPFYTTKAASHGTGLGLAIVRGIVEQHGGWIDVESHPGRGSDFRVYLPASPDLQVDEETGEFQLESYIGAGQTILLVEDDEGVRSFARRALGLGKYEVTEAPSAEEAIGILERTGGGFDLVFTDVVLPGMSGVDLVSILGERWPDLGILLTSGYTDQKSQWQKILDRGYHFLPKPYDVPALLKNVRKAIR